MVPPLRAFLTRFRPRPRWWLGTPYRATIRPFDNGRYVLTIACTEGVDWIDLADRIGKLHPDDHPDARDFVAAADELDARGLAWVLPFGLDEHGNLTAPVTRKERTP